MLEPWAASVFNSLLASGPAIAAHSAHSTRRIMARRTSSFPQDFFSPHPRRAKGKERAVQEHQCGLCGDATSSALGCAALPAQHEDISAHAIPSSSSSSSRPRARRLSGRRPLENHRTKSIPPYNVWLSQADGVRRRHMSSNHDPDAHEPPAAVPSLEHLTNPPDEIELSTQLRRIALETYSFDEEEAWELYRILYARNACASLTPMELLRFALRLSVTASGSMHDGRTSPATMLAWASRLDTLMQHIDPRVDHSPFSAEDLKWQCLVASTKALSDQLDEAVVIVRAINTSNFPVEHRLDIIRTNTTVILAMQHHQDPLTVLHYVVEEWASLYTYLERFSVVWSMEAAVHSFRRSLFAIIACIERPNAIITDAQHEWPRTRLRRTGELIIEADCASDLALDALAVLGELHRQQISVTPELQLIVVRALVKSDHCELANALFESLSKWMPQGRYHRDHATTGLYLFAHQGDVDRAQQAFDDIEFHDWLTHDNVALLMHVHAVRADPDSVVALFNKYFSTPEVENPRIQVTIVHYTTIILAYARSNDFERMNFWLEAMNRAGIRPDMHVYNIILHSFGQRGEVESMAAILDQMRAAGIQPSRVCYTTVISTLARREDPVSAEAMYKRAIREGVVPDRQMVSALMHAHVESGSWKGVIRAFDYIKSSGNRGLRLTIEVYNTLLKAYLLIGAPFRVMAHIFDRLQETQVRPNKYTFALMIQAACDAGYMSTALRLFAQMESLSKHWQSGIHLNVYVLTVMITGFLRRGRKKEANDLIQRMKIMDIKPTSVTFSAMIRQYANSKGKEDIRRAEKYLRKMTQGEIIEDWDKPLPGIRTSIERLFSPLMGVYSRAHKPEQVERLFKMMLAAGGPPTIGTLTMLLDSNRRTNRWDAVLEIWPQIVRLGLRRASLGSLFNDVEETDKPHADYYRRGNVLCVPLSIYIDSLSRAGMHKEIAEVWKSFATQGVAFDSHNWNHLAISLVRAGEPERAFEVVERVLLPYQRRSRVTVDRDEAPVTPVTFDNPPPDEGDGLPEALPEAPMHNTRERESVHKLLKNKTKHSLHVARPDDFAHPLHVLQQISPAWHSWRPHGLLLYVLSKVLGHLEAGHMVQPIMPGDTAFDRAVRSVEELRERQMRAGEILMRITHDYPDTLRAIARYKGSPRPTASSITSTSTRGKYK